ncbi:MAG: hypothetical protein WD180_05380 [Pseudohongiellaceae bacterium]
MIPFHLQTLAQADPEIALDVPPPRTALAVIRTLEAKYPTLRGAILDLETGKRRPMVRLFVCQEDISHDSMEKPLPKDVIDGKEPFLIVGAISGG